LGAVFSCPKTQSGCEPNAINSDAERRVTHGGLGLALLCGFFMPAHLHKLPAKIFVLGLDFL